MLKKNLAVQKYKSYQR